MNGRGSLRLAMGYPPPNSPPAVPRRRRVLLRAATLVALGAQCRGVTAEPAHPRRAWYLEARRMRELAESWGDQRYGAVVVLEGVAVGLGPSRVVKDRDPEAHAERVALRAAALAVASAASGASEATASKRARGSRPLEGAVLYSTSRPCAACEQAAAEAGIARMYFGEDLHDAGVPRAR